MRRLAPLVTALSLLTAPLAAHEFWLEPNAYRVAPGTPLEARAINGENFFGIEYSYSERSYARSGIIAGDTQVPITGKSGQKPAIAQAPAAEGLNILYHASPINTLTYANFTKFENFLKGKRLDGGIAEHKRLDLPEEGIKEVYFRYVKALVAVGNGAGSDRAVGMPYEWIALTNPYTDSGPMRFRLVLNGQSAREGIPAYVFHKRGTEVETTKLVTGKGGVVSVPRAPGDYLLNAVHLTRPNTKIEEATKAHWVTLWAALTYQIE